MCTCRIGARWHVVRSECFCRQEISFKEEEKRRENDRESPYLCKIQLYVAA